MRGCGGGWRWSIGGLGDEGNCEHGFTDHGAQIKAELLNVMASLDLYLPK